MGIVLSACARRRARASEVRHGLTDEEGGEQRFAVWRAADAGGAELGARVLDGVVGELRASGLGAGEDLGSSGLLPLAHSGSEGWPSAMWAFEGPLVAVPSPLPCEPPQWRTNSKKSLLARRMEIAAEREAIRSG